ncbi:MAG: Fur family transcriptional regulator, ferric uptake regulator [Candidatus Sumerlaeota bacterium]|nr:Fur family transcriptional regulator, ferric uptake regulator [Candidatus Sumerlaeota bacterium]
MTPQDVWEEARKEVPSLGIATVYRMVKTMLEAGELQRIEVPGHPPRYEMRAKGLHHHFYCRKCDQLFSIKGSPRQVQSLVPKGFVLEGQDIVLYGVCEECPSSSSART